MKIDCNEVVGIWENMKIECNEVVGIWEHTVPYNINIKIK